MPAHSITSAQLAARRGKRIKADQDWDAKYEAAKAAPTDGEYRQAVEYMLESLRQGLDKLPAQRAYEIAKQAVSLTHGQR